MEPIDPITYVQDAISSIEGDVWAHSEGEVSQELSDRIYGLQLAYQDLKALRPTVDQDHKTIYNKVESFSGLTHVEKHDAEAVDRVSQRVISRSAPPEGVQPIPNKKDNCFLITAYQFAKLNTPQIFDSEGFKNDKKLAPLRRFNEKYDQGPVTAADMHKVRTSVLTQFEIEETGHQDANEALQAVFFNHVDQNDPLLFDVETTRTYELTVPREQMEIAQALIDSDKKVIEIREEGKNVTFRLQTVLKEPQLSLELSLDGIQYGASFDEVIEQDLTALGESIQISPEFTLKQVEVNCSVPKAPNQVIMGLKRFDAFGNKLRTQVEIPNGQVHLGGETYNVKGFIVHKGVSQDIGHYVNYQKIKGQWYLFNDGRALRPISEETAIIAMRDVYVLCAEKIPSDPKLSKRSSVSGPSSTKARHHARSPKSLQSLRRAMSTSSALRKFRQIKNSKRSRVK